MHLYVIGFSHGVVKVGYSSKPHDRITYHTKNCRNHDRYVVDKWMSEPGEGSRLLEKLLLDWCRIHEIDHERRSAEYFKLPFDAVVSQARHLIELYQPLVLA